MFKRILATIISFIAGTCMIIVTIVGVIVGTVIRGIKKIRRENG